MIKITKKVVEKNISEVIPYEKNPRKNDAAVDKVANSIREFGFRSPIIVDEHNVIICGHTRLKAAIKLGLKTVPCVVADGLTDKQIKAYRLADNKVGELAEWNEELLNAELSELDGMDAFGFLDNDTVGLDDDKYVSIGDMVQYEPKTECPAIDELIVEDKKNELIEAITKSNAPPAIKEFLKKAASRHDAFNFAKIAEFYAHQSKGVQELMEASGLVIIDFKDAIKNGFVSLDGSLRSLAEEIGGTDE